MRKWMISFLFIVLCFLFPQNAQADGIIIPEPPFPGPIPMRQLDIRYHKVDVTIEDQVAITRVDQVFYNPNETTVEGEYIFPLPEGAVATGFKLWIDGQPVQGEVLSADEAKALFSGKTFDGYNEIKGRSYRVYSDPSGTMIHKNAKRTKEFAWEIDGEGRHCAIFSNGPRCGKIVSVGDGVYHKVSDGEHINTLKNFVDGNKL